MARPSLADSLRASLSRGAHVETAEKIARGFDPVEDVSVQPVSVDIDPVTIDKITPTAAKQPTKRETNQKTNNQDKLKGNEPANIQTNTPVIYPDSEPVNYTANPVNVPTNEAKPDNEPGKVPTNKPVSEPVYAPVINPAIYPVNEPASNIDNLLTKSIDPELWYPYTENQGKVLLYLIQAGGRTKREHIANDTGVNIATVKYTLRVLVKDGYISQTVLDVNHKMRGFAYSLNQHLCSEYAGRILGSDFKGISQTANYPVNRPVNYPNIRPNRSPVIDPDRRFSSSSFLEETLTTTKAVGNEVLVGPEAAYWLDAGLQERQTLKWCEDFEVSTSEMRQQLAWARWDLLENRKEADVTKDVINWFFGCLRKTAGCYPRPDNYKSPAEVRAAAIKLQHEKDKEAQDIIATSELDREFQAIMSNPDGEAYKKLYAQVSGFAKEQGGFALELGLRELYFNQK